MDDLGDPQLLKDHHMLARDDAVNDVSQPDATVYPNGVLMCPLSGDMSRHGLGFSYLIGGNHGYISVTAPAAPSTHYYPLDFLGHV